MAKNVFNVTTFDYEKHYKELYYKIFKLLRDFDIKKYIDFKAVTGLNNCSECHINIDEPKTHEQAKKKIFKLFINEPYYLVESEQRANKDLFVPGKGIRNYQFDIFVVNIPNFLKYLDVMETYLLDDNTTELDIDTLQEIEQDLYFAVEVDGGSHSDEKDAVRDRFFFLNYNIVTVRYEVNDLVHVEETKKMKKTRLKYNIYRSFQEQPLLHNITSERIVSDAKNLYRKEYLHIT